MVLGEKWRLCQVVGRCERLVGPGRCVGWQGRAGRVVHRAEKLGSDEPLGIRSVVVEMG